MATKSTTLFSLTTVKDHLNVSSTNDDDTLDIIADGVSERIEVMTARKFVTQTLGPKAFDAKGRDRLFLPSLCVASITLVRTRQAMTDEWATVAATEYELDGDTGIIYLTGDAGVGSFFPSGPRTTEVTWVEGYGVQDSTDIPRDLFMAGLDWCKFVYERQSAGTTMMQSVSIGGFSASMIPEPPKDIKAIILGYKRWRGLC